MSFYRRSGEWAAKSLGAGRIRHFPAACRSFGTELTEEAYQPCRPRTQMPIILSTLFSSAGLEFDHLKTGRGAENRDVHRSGAIEERRAVKSLHCFRVISQVWHRIALLKSGILLDLRFLPV